MLKVENDILDSDTYLTTVSGPKSSYPSFLNHVRAAENTGDLPELVATKITLSVTEFVAQMIFRIL